MSGALLRAMNEFTRRGYTAATQAIKNVKSARGAASSTGEVSASGGAVPPGRTLSSTSTGGSGTGLVPVSRSAVTPVLETSQTVSKTISADVIDAEFTEVIKQGGLKGLFKNAKFSKLSRNQKIAVISGGLAAGTVTVDQVADWLDEGNMPQDVAKILTAALSNSEPPIPSMDYDPSSDTSIHDLDIDQKIAGEKVSEVVVSYERVKYASSLYSSLCLALGKQTVDNLLEFIALDDDLQIIGQSV